jgi:hypothetical protein
MVVQMNTHKDFRITSAVRIEAISKARSATSSSADYADFRRLTTLASGNLRHLRVTAL